MAELNTVLQPTTDVPSTLFTASVQTSPAQATPSVALPAQPQATPVAQSSTAEPTAQAATVNKGLEEMVVKQNELIQQMYNELQLVKKGAVMSAMAQKNNETSIEEKLADFFGYTE